MNVLTSQNVRWFCINYCIYTDAMEMLTSLTPGVGYSNGNGISVKTKTSNIITTDIIVAYCSSYAVIVFIVLRNSGSCSNAKRVLNFSQL